MIYENLKILHICSAAVVLGSIFYCCQLWYGIRQAADPFGRFGRIQRQTILIILPGSLVQLATGFTLLSLKQHSLSGGWIITSIEGFLMLVAAWSGFVFFLSASLRETCQTLRARRRFYQHAQSVMLLLCGLSIALMVFSMTSRFNGFPGAA